MNLQISSLGLSVSSVMSGTQEEAIGPILWKISLTGIKKNLTEFSFGISIESTNFPMNLQTSSLGLSVSSVMSGTQEEVI